MEGYESAFSSSSKSDKGRNFAAEVLDLLDALNIDQIEPLDVENIELAETELALPDAVRQALESSREGEEEKDEGSTSPLERLTSLLLEQAYDSQQHFQQQLSNPQAADETAESSSYAIRFWKDIMNAKPKAILQLKTLLHCLIASAAPDSTSVSEESEQILGALRSIQAFFALISIPGSSVYRICSNYTARVVLIRLKSLLKGSLTMDSTRDEATKVIDSASLVAHGFSLSGCGIPYESLSEFIETIASAIPHCESSSAIFSSLESTFSALLANDAKYGGEVSKQCCKQFKYYLQWNSNPNHPVSAAANSLTVTLLSKLVKEEGEDNTGYGRQAALALCHHLAVDDQKKANERWTAIQTIKNILPLLSVNMRLNFLSLLSKLLRSSRSKQRHFAVQLGGQFMSEDWMWELLGEESTNETAKAYTSSPQAHAAEHQDSATEQGSNQDPVSKFVRSLMHRCVDRSPPVRAAAIYTAKALLQQAMDSEASNMVMKVLEVLNEGCERGSMHRQGEISMNISHYSKGDNNMPLLALLLRRSDDENAHVRKAAVEALETLCIAQVYQFNGRYSIQDLAGEYTIQVLAAKSSDNSTIVRKASIAALSSLMLRENSDTVREAWLAGVLPLVCDPEKGVQDKALQYASSILLDPIHNESANGTENKFWNVFRQVYESQPLRNSLSYALELLWQQDTQTKSVSIGKILDITLDVVNFSTNSKTSSITEKEAGAWILMSLTVGATYSKKDIQCKLQSIFELIQRQWPKYYQTLSGDENNVSNNRTIWLILGSMVSTLKTCCKKLKVEFPLHEDVIISLDSMESLSNSSAEFIRQGVEALVSDDLVYNDASSHAMQVVTNAEKYLERVTLEGENGYTRKYAVPQLYILGELALVRAVSNETSESTKESPFFRSKLLTLIEALTMPTAQFESKQLSSELRAHAFLCLGKLCLTNTELARRYVKVFITELMSPWRNQQNCDDTEAGVEIRNNLLLTLGDLCMRYPGLVENYSEQLAASLRDPHPLIRRQAVAMLSTLLQQDFLKWRAKCLHRFFACLIDEDELVRRAAHQAITGRMLIKHPNLLSAHFVEAVFVLSGAEQHPSFQAIFSRNNPQEVGNDIQATLPPLAIQGADAQELRLEIYRTLFRAMKPEQKLTVQAKLITDILSPIAEGTVPVNSEDDATASQTNDLIVEVLRVLQMKDIRVTASNTTEQEDTTNTEDDTEALEAGLVAAKQRVLNRMAQKHTLERTVPVLMKLKSLLASIQSPILKSLMEYLRSLWMTYKESFSDAVASDRRLAAELEYDVKQWKNEMRRSKARGQAEEAKESKECNENDVDSGEPTNKRMNTDSSARSSSLFSLAL